MVFFSPIHYICIKAANIYLNKQYLYSDKWLMKSYYQQIFRKPKSKKKKEEHLLGAESYVWWRPHVTDVGLTQLYYIIYIKSCPTLAHDNMCEQRFPPTSERLVQADYRSRLAIYILMFLCFSFIVLSILATTYRPTASTLHRPYIVINVYQCNFKGFNICGSNKKQKEWYMICNVPVIVTLV